MTVLSAAALLLGMIGVFFVIFIKRTLTYWKRKGVFSAKPEFLFGNARNLIMQRDGLGSTLQALYMQLKTKSLRYGGYYLFTRPTFVLADLDLIKKITSSDFEYFDDRLLHNHQLHNPLSKHLGTLTGAEWKTIRGKLSPAFTTSKTKLIIPTVIKYINNVSAVLDNIAENKGTLEMKDLSSKISIDILALCAFGIESNTIKNTNTEFHQYVSGYFNNDSFIRLLKFFCPQLLILFRARSARKDVSTFFLKLVNDIIKLRESNNVVSHDFMHLLLQIRNNVNVLENTIGDVVNTENQDVSLSIEEITANSLIFFATGSESSSSANAFCLYELALNQGLQEKAREEVRRVVEKHNGQLDYDAILNMPFIEKCIKETFRKYPPLPFLYRQSSKNYKVPESDLIVEKGTLVFIPLLGIHRDPEIYPNPEEYDPERFSQENIANRDSSSWMPFGNGPRNCIAYKFGFTQVKVVLATLLKNYKFTLSPMTAVPLKIDYSTTVTRSAGGIWLNIEKVA